MSYPAGKLDLVKIQDAIYDWVRTQTLGLFEEDGRDDGSRIIWRNQSHALPPRPCITLKITDGPSPVGRQGNQHNNSDGTFGFGIQMEMTVSIQVFGNTKVCRPIAMQAALDLNSSLMLPCVLSSLNKGGAAVQQVGDLQNITALEESEYEERWAFEVQFGLAQNLKDKLQTIDTVNITGIVDTQVTGL